MPPDHVWQIEPKVRSIKRNDFPVPSVIEHNIETAGQGNKEFLKLLVGVATANFSARHVIDPVSSLNDKRHRATELYEGEIAAVVGDLGKRDGSAIIQTVHFFIPNYQF